MMVRAAAPPDACWVCGLPKSKHRPCAICFATNEHTKLCERCKADPANVGWSETWEEFGSGEDIAGNDHVRVTQRLYEVADRPIKNERPIVVAILRQFSEGKLSMRQIAVAVGRSKSFVQYVYRTRLLDKPKTWKK